MNTDRKRMGTDSRQFEHYQRAVAFLESLVNLGNSYPRPGMPSEAYLDRTRDFLRRIGNPERSLRFIHVGGTAGKGSVSTMIAQALTASGKRTGLFTSPFVTTATEKISIDGQYISADEFADLVDELKPAIDAAYAKGAQGGPSYFEICLALALLYFKRKGCTIVVLEVGLGGAFDATNAVPGEAKLATAVTNIGLDHMEILGKSLNKIARAKAGIIKPGVPFFTTEARKPLLKLFQTRCREVGAPFYVVPAGRQPNRALAGAICRSLGVAEGKIAMGTSRVDLPARFELMQENPLVIIDGAHNPDKMANTAARLAELNYKRLLVVVALAQSKSATATLKPILKHADTVFATRFTNPLRPCHSPKSLAQAMHEAAMHEVGLRAVVVKEYLDPTVALEAALKQAKKGDLVLVTGSFYLAGELRERWYSEDWVLKHRRCR